MAPGAGVIKYGENGKGIGSRWYAGTLAKRVRDIGRLRGKIGFMQGDGLAVIREHTSEVNTAFFIDPPYTAAGKRAGTRLYRYNALDHEVVFTLAESLRGPFLMTYDNTEGVRELAVRHGLLVEIVAMSNTHHAKMEELLVSKDLGWVRSPLC